MLRPRADIGEAQGAALATYRFFEPFLAIALIAIFMRWSLANT